MWYNFLMYNWSVDTKHLKNFPKAYRIWKLEQLVNFGLGNEKISKSLLVRYFDTIDIDPQKRKYLKFLLSSK